MDWMIREVANLSKNKRGRRECIRQTKIEFSEVSVEQCSSCYYAPSCHFESVLEPTLTLEQFPWGDSTAGSLLG